MNRGLYDAASEHDACGVGMVVNIRGDKTHELVENALKVLENMRHRGAEGADGKSGVEGRVPFLDKEFLDVAMRFNPAAKMCPGTTIEKRAVREAFSDLLPDEIAWRQKEQFSDGVGYSWIDTLKRITAEAVSDRQMANAAERFPIHPPLCKEEYYYRSIFEEFFPSASAARSVPSVPSVACSSAEALAWDASFQGKNDPSGRAVTGVHTG